MELVNRVWQRLLGMGRLLLPAPGPRKPPRLWLKRLLLVGLILTLLTLCNQLFRIYQLVEAPLGWPSGFWLPLVGLLMYLSLWCGWGLWYLGTRPLASPFADLDRAWQQTLTQLEQAGISLHEVPVVVVLGLPLSGEAGLIKGSRLTFNVQQAPRPGAPIQVYACSELILVFCHNASVLCKLARYATGAVELWPEPTRRGQPPAQPVEVSLFSGSDAEVGLQSARAAQPVGLPGIAPASPTDRDQLIGLSRLQVGSSESEWWTARLTHLLTLLRQARRPYCPLNGLLVLLPQSVLASAPGPLAALVRHEVASALATVQVRTTATLLVCDLEQSQPFAEFLARMPLDQLTNTLGVCMPDTAELDPTTANQYSANALNWLSLRLQQLVNRLLLPPTNAGHTLRNRRLVQWLLDWPRYQAGLKLIVERLHAIEPRLLGTPNIYLAATGKLPSEQGFLPDVFVNLLEAQNRVAWTETALQNDRRCWQIAVVVWVVLTVAALGVVGYAVY